MVLRHRQKLWQRIVLSWFTIILLFISCILLARSLWDIYQKNRQSNTRADTARAQLDKLIERRDLLDKNLQRIKSSAGVEAELRSKFDVAKDGENLLVIIDKEMKQSVTPTPAPWWQNLWHKMTQ